MAIGDLIHVDVVGSKHDLSQHGRKMYVRKYMRRITPDDLAEVVGEMTRHGRRLGLIFQATGEQVVEEVENMAVRTLAREDVLVAAVNNDAISDLAALKYDPLDVLNHARNRFLAQTTMIGDSIDDVKRMITLEEGQELEKKASLRWDYNQDKVNKALSRTLVEEIAAFLNADGGTLLVGVSDDGKVLGLDKDYASLRKRRDGFFLTLGQVISSEIPNELPGLYVVKIFTVDGLDVCQIRVVRSPEPVFMNDGGFWVRKINRKVQLTAREATEYISKHWSAKGI